MAILKTLEFATGISEYTLHTNSNSLAHSFVHTFLFTHLSIIYLFCTRVISFEPKCGFYIGDQFRPFFWTNQSCSNKLKVLDDGRIAIVHEPNLDINEEVPDIQRVSQLVDEENKNYFKVGWDKGIYPKSSNQCGVCVVLPDDSCLCDVELTAKQVS